MSHWFRWVHPVGNPTAEVRFLGWPVTQMPLIWSGLESVSLQTRELWQAFCRAFVPTWVRFTATWACDARFAPQIALADRDDQYGR